MQSKSQDTFPIVVNECGALGEEKYRNLVEMIENLVENKVARGKFTGRHTYGGIPALSACIMYRFVAALVVCIFWFAVLSAMCSPSKLRPVPEGAMVLQVWSILYQCT